MKIYFDHEKLDVYQQSLAFCGWAGELLDKITGKAAAKDQLDRSSTSMPLNIAEGNGKFSDADRARFLEIARGSALECAAALDVLVVRKFVTVQQIVAGKEQLVSIVKMLMGLLKRFSGRADFLREEQAEYASGPQNQSEVDYEQEHDQEQEQEQENGSNDSTT